MSLVSRRWDSTGAGVVPETPPRAGGRAGVGRPGVKCMLGTKTYFIHTWPQPIHMMCCMDYRVQWLRGRASDSRLRKPVFESCAAM